MNTLISYLLKRIPRKYLQKYSRLGTFILPIIYAGRKVCCPLCKKHFRKFMPYGHLIIRKNALCPNCLALERHRQIWLYIEKKTNLLQSSGSILHIAPEMAFIHSFRKFHNINYVTGDIESPWANIKMDVQDIPFKNDIFDVFICNHVLEHIENDMLALKELHRILKPGGWGIITCPQNFSKEKTFEDKNITTPEEREKYFGQKDHLRVYGRDFPERMQISGFEVETIESRSVFTPEEIHHYALPNDPIYIVRKHNPCVS